MVSLCKLNTWHKLTIQGRTDSPRQIRLYYAYNATVGTGHTFTVDGTANFPSMSIAWYHGVQLSSDPFIAENGNTVLFSSSLSTGAVTPTEEDCLVVVGAEFEANGAGGSCDSGFVVDAVDTDTSFGHEQSAIGHLTQTTPAAAASTTWSQASSSTICVAIAAFKSVKAVTYAGSVLKSKRPYRIM